MKFSSCGILKCALMLSLLLMGGLPGFARVIRVHASNGATVSRYFALAVNSVQVLDAYVAVGGTVDFVVESDYSNLSAYSPTDGWYNFDVPSGVDVQLYLVGNPNSDNFFPSSAAVVAASAPGYDFEIPETIEVPGLGEVTLPSWAAGNAELAFFFFGFAAAVGIRLVRAGLRWFKRADGVGDVS